MTEEASQVKSPKQLRTEIQTLRSSVEGIRDTLLHKVRDAREPAWGIGRDCARTAEALDSILKTQVVPEHYKVAVVGRFKAGKSSFVNELLGARLAGEDTSPETAAVTTFVHGSTVKARIRFVGADAWDGFRKLHAEDPKHIDAHRMKMWLSFDGKARKNAEGQVVETFDLAALERTYVKPGGHVLEITLDKPGEKSAENAFRRRLKEFTSGTRPHHCLVEGIEITSPSLLLEEGVLLVDTPGLDDTERFRVTLTEKAVEEVDAVLFLTQSGVAYGQSEKDFMLTLLRRGTVKQLIFVITQVDKTYEQHLSAAEDNDEDPETLAHRIRREERRIRDEIDATLAELGSDDSPAMRRYREQLGVVGLVFTSARKHRDWKDGKAVEHGIHPEDPGGIERMKAQLLKLLSTESRLAMVAHNIASGSKSALDDLLGVITNRRAALRDIRDGEVAEQRLATFRKDFESARQRFQSAAESDVAILRKNLEDADKRNDHLIEAIGLLADRELGAFESTDVGKHWKTRRSGYWGYMHDLQGKVANKIFPRVQQLLSDMTAHFAVFVEHFEKHLSALSSSSGELAEKLDLGATLPFDLTKTLAGSLEKSLAAANDLIAAEEQRIVSFLDDFVSDEVSDKISAAREKVADIFGKGTTYHQSNEVRAFYSEVRNLLQDALTAHLRERGAAFGRFLVVEADGVPRNALAEVDATLAGAEQDIKAAATAHIGGERESFERECDGTVSAILGVVEACTPLLETPEDPVPQPPDVPEKERAWTSEYGAETEDWFESIQKEATKTRKRLRLNDGDAGWPFEKIFERSLLSGCSRIALIDPYLALPHQVRNLKEFLLVVAEVAKPKEILVVTSATWNEGTGASARIMDEVGTDLFRSFGTSLTIRIDPTIHDRYVVCDHGLLFKLGRGLDIYKPATGLASHRPASRRVRRTDIDVFTVPGFKDGAP
ncbi:dynamin family protein [Cognatazoarcus halotolerans]|uniref:dynamin family protein n=1 Tax=Cognatazoarcus halotolerans TaxID=2686016 RepID=UPI001358E96D|nr:dynamin family protein [Cognatazoarcus halotolerans]